MTKFIYIKELKHYFNSIIGYIFLAILMLIGGFIFTTGNLLSQSGDIRLFFSSFFTVLLFLIPMLTMRQLSEEKKMKTMQLLLTLPLSIKSIVLGKFFATMTIIGFGLVLTLIYPVILAFFSAFELMVVLGNYLGLILLISSIVSIGIFVSSLTENQIVSSVVSYAIILGFWLTDSLTPFILSSPVVRFINQFSLRINYLEFTYGILNPASIIFYISITALFLILTTASLDSRRQ